MAALRLGDAIATQRRWALTRRRPTIGKLEGCDELIGELIEHFVVGIRDRRDRHGQVEKGGGALLALYRSGGLWILPEDDSLTRTERGSAESDIGFDAVPVRREKLAQRGRVSVRQPSDWARRPKREQSLPVQRRLVAFGQLCGQPRSYLVQGDGGFGAY